MAYVKIIFQNSPSTATPINAQNLNHMDDQIALNDQRLTELEGAHVSSFNGRTGAVTPSKGDYDIGQIAPLTGAQVGQVPVVVNVGTEENPELEFQMGAGGGGGHVIQNASGTDMAQESAMQFPDSHVSDDSVNGRTVVENVKEVTLAELEQATERGMYLATDEESVPIGASSEDYEEVIGDGTITYENFLILLHSKIDASKVTKEAKLVRGTDNLIIYQMGLNYLNNTAPNNYADFFSLDATGGRTQDCDIIRLGSSPAYYTLNGGTGAGANHLTSPVPSGTVLRFYYGTSSTVINLKTSADYCMMSDGVTSVESALKYTNKVLGYYDRLTSSNQSITLTKDVTLIGYTKPDGYGANATVTIGGTEYVNPAFFGLQVSSGTTITTRQSGGLYDISVYFELS